MKQTKMAVDQLVQVTDREELLNYILASSQPLADFNFKNSNFTRFEMRTVNHTVFILIVYKQTLSAFDIFYSDMAVDLNICKDNFDLIKDDAGICLNNQTVGNLKKYLSGFKNDAKVIMRTGENYFDVEIGCNEDYQKKVQEVLLLKGFPVEVKNDGFAEGERPTDEK